MARSFHRKQTLQPMSELNVTALIDLGFALLIIFMIATPLIEVEQTLEVTLPVASPSKSEAPSERVNITILKNGYAVDGNRLNDIQLEDEMALYAEMSEQPVLSLRTDADTEAQRLVTVIDLAKKYELRKINIATRSED